MQMVARPTIKMQQQSYSAFIHCVTIILCYVTNIYVSTNCLGLTFSRCNTDVK